MENRGGASIAARGEHIIATILIADDDDTMQMLMEHTLRRARHEVLLAADGQQAVSLARTHQPDLLIFDTNMPELSGANAIAQLRAEGVWTPAILITAGACPISAQDDVRTHFLPKPFSPPRLNAFVADVLKEALSCNPF